MTLSPRLQNVKAILENDSLSLEEKLRAVVQERKQVREGLHQGPVRIEEKNFYDLCEELFNLGNRNVPFRWWDDIIAEILELMKVLLQDPTVPPENLPGFQEMRDHKYDRVNELLKIPNEDIQYCFTVGLQDCGALPDFTDEEIEFWRKTMSIRYPKGYP
jgi:hypothetical protein